MAYNVYFGNCPRLDPLASTPFQTAFLDHFAWCPVWIWTSSHCEIYMPEKFPMRACTIWCMSFPMLNTSPAGSQPLTCLIWFIFAISSNWRFYEWCSRRLCFNNFWSFFVPVKHTTSMLSKAWLRQVVIFAYRALTQKPFFLLLYVKYIPNNKSAINN